MILTLQQAQHLVLRSVWEALLVGEATSERVTMSMQRQIVWFAFTEPVAFWSMVLGSSCAPQGTALHWRGAFGVLRWALH